MEALSLNLAERRVACDGESYTFKESVDFYGFNALSRWQTSSAEQPVDTIVGQSESKRKGPLAPVTLKGQRRRDKTPFDHDHHQ